MNIFFDMDHTLLALDESLRPGTKETFQQIKDDGHDIYVWSGVGIRWPEVRHHKLESFVTDCFQKPTEQYVEKAKKQGLPVWPDLVIDDYPEVCQAFGGIWIRPFYFYNAQDEEMAHMYRVIKEYALTGTSVDIQFHAPPPNGRPL
ncbi:MAG: HAD hydrolase family protein [Chloroflexi bacterium]|nr:HAD hydrolase family protein [Chloroflexota bacterium]